MQNSVLESGHRKSKNFYTSDHLLQHYLNTRLSARGLAYMNDKLERLGAQAACEMDKLSMVADKQGPVLNKRNFYGETVNEIRFHPAYWRMAEIAVESEMFRVKWEPELRNRFQEERHRLGFAAGFLFAMAESGLYCPLCMTDGVAVLIDRYCTEADRERLLPHIYTDKADELYTGAMFLTEKAGGSDVGANLVTATPTDGDYWKLNGEKWFCSNANAQIIFALARTRPEIAGTRGLGIFLMEPTLADGTHNPFDIIRLKDKLGVRSMASGEFLLQDTLAKLVGGETEGFKIMTDMINLSRLYNSVAALAGMRRALIEAYQFLKFRKSFGKPMLEHPLIRTKLLELGALYQAHFYLTWRAVEAMDNAENGDENEAALIRLLTPMTKKTTAEGGVYIVRESMELMGGMGYIEDGIMPKLMRDVLVLPIWEGAGNIMVLDMLRAALKSEGLPAMLKEIETAFDKMAKTSTNSDLWEIAITELRALEGLLSQLPLQSAEVVQATAKPAFERLTQFYHLTCLCRYRDEDSAAWIDVALDYLLKGLKTSSVLNLVNPPSISEIDLVLGWSID